MRKRFRNEERDGSDRPYKQSSMGAGFKRTMVDGRIVQVDTDEVPFKGMDYRRPDPMGFGSREDSSMRHVDDTYKSVEAGPSSGAVIRSEGRGQPMLQQSPITVVYVAPKTDYDSLAKNMEKDMIAPLGDRQDHSIIPGEILFSVKNQGLRSSMRGSKLGNLNNYGDWKVSSTVNGRNKNKETFFSGVATTATDAKNMNSDNTGTALVFGTQTTVNTGPLLIRPGERVEMSMTPYTKLEGGKVVPAISVRGVPPTKFRPATYPHNPTTMKSLAGHAIDAVVAAMGAPNEDPFESQDAFNQKLSVAREYLRNCYDGVDRRKQPIDYFLRYSMLSRAFVVRDGDQKVFQEIAKGIWNEEKQDAQEVAINLFLEIADPPELADTNKLVEFVEKRKAHALIDQENHMNRHLIGTCLNESPPGQPLDLAINVF